jgi:hypothetical protein
MEACLENARANPEKMNAGLEEMEAAVETNQEEVNSTISSQIQKKKKP